MSANQEPVASNNKIQLTRTTLIGAVVIIAILAFTIGTRSHDILAKFGMGQSQQSASLDFSSVEEVYDKLRQKYDGKLDTNQLIDGAKKGLVEATGDPYTTYFTDKEAKDFFGDLDGKFSGIGAELDKKDNRLVIVSTLDDSPARKAGLMPNDIIVKVNDQDASAWSTDKAVSEIRGEKGTTVKLTLVRGQDIKEFSIARADIINPSVKSEITPDNIGIIRIARFAETDTATLTQKAVEDFKAKGVKAVVLDMRGNGGGYLTAAQQVASLWLDKDQVIVQERRDKTVTDTLRADGNPPLKGVPTVVLVDGGSASASEIVAGALQDHGIAKLVGLKTFGKGSVQQIESIPSGGQLKVTWAKWYTPHGKNISKEGIAPDVKVDISDDDVKNGRDPQKDKALEMLRNH